MAAPGPEASVRPPGDLGLRPRGERGGPKRPRLTLRPCHKRQGCTSGEAPTSCESCQRVQDVYEAASRSPRPVRGNVTPGEMAESQIPSYVGRVARRSA